MLICYNRMTGSGCRAENPEGSERCQACDRPLNYALHLHDPGTTIQKYRVERVLGFGGYGAVYEAQDEQGELGRVALKETFDPDQMDNFQSEFDIIKALTHPHLPQYYQVFKTADYGYLVMELIPGQSLAEIIKKQKGPLVEAQVLGYAVQLCDTLTYLHTQEKPILHRDIKPDNIRLTPEGLIKLVDFGLLKQGSEATHSSRAGLTPAYAPIEQYLGDRTEPRSDIYSLAATFYHLMTGRAPISAFDRTVAKSDPLPSPRRFNQSLSPHVAQAVMIAMSLSMQDRYPHAAAFKQGLIVGTPAAGPTSTLSPPNTLATGESLSGSAPAISRPASTPQVTTSTQSVSLAIKARLVRTMRQHSGVVWQVAFNPAGDLLASGSWDNTIRLWQVNTGHELRRIQGHNYPVYGLAFSPDGQTLVSGSVDKMVRLWDVSTCQEIRQFSGHANVPSTLAFSPDGRTLASGSTGKVIRLWDVATGREMRQLEGHMGSVYEVTFTPNGRTLASGSKDGTIRIWDVATGREMRRLEEHRSTVYTVRFSPDGRALASGSKDGSVWLRQVDGSGWERKERKGNAVYSLSFSPNGKALALGCGDGTVRLWDVATGHEVWHLKGHGEAIHSLAFSPDGQTLASGGLDNTIRLWQVMDT